MSTSPAVGEGAQPGEGSGILVAPVDHQIWDKYWQPTTTSGIYWFHGAP